ncbi:MAG: hypothetical protein ACI81R_002328, partial [Bradymonadia bacterium]
MSDTKNENQNPVDPAEADNVSAAGPAVDGGNYEVIRRRLVAQGKSLRAKADLLNEARTEIFGSSKLEV